MVRQEAFPILIRWPGLLSPLEVNATAPDGCVARQVLEMPLRNKDGGTQEAIQRAKKRTW